MALGHGDVVWNSGYDISEVRGGEERSDELTTQFLAQLAC